MALTKASPFCLKRFCLFHAYATSERWLHKTCIYFSLWKGLTFYIKVSIKPLDEISLSASVLIYYFGNLKRSNLRQKQLGKLLSTTEAA